MGQGAQVDSVALGHGKVFMRRVPDFFGVLALPIPCCTRGMSGLLGYEGTVQLPPVVRLSGWNWGAGSCALVATSMLRALVNDAV